MNQEIEPRQQLPFEGLHVYQRLQDAWTLASSLNWNDRVAEAIGSATEAVARATGTVRGGGSFSDLLIEARGHVHVAAARIEHEARAFGKDPNSDLRAMLVDASRMIGALVRTIERAETPAVPEVS